MLIGDIKYRNMFGHEQTRRRPSIVKKTIVTISNVMKVAILTLTFGNVTENTDGAAFRLEAWLSSDEFGFASMSKGALIWTCTKLGSSMLDLLAKSPFRPCRDPSILKGIFFDSQCFNNMSASIMKNKYITLIHTCISCSWVAYIKYIYSIIFCQMTCLVIK